MYGRTLLCTSRDVALLRVFNFPTTEKKHCRRRAHANLPTNPPSPSPLVSLLFNDAVRRNGTFSDQGFLNSFYPYFAACPAFEPYPIVGSRLPGVGSIELGGGGGGRKKAKGGGRELEHNILPGVEATDAKEEGGSENGEVAAGAPAGPEANRRGLAGKGGGEGEWARPKGWGCKRLPTRYNGDWPLLFVDGDLQMVQGKEAGPEAPADWKRRKKVKVLHYTFGTAKPW